MEQREKVPVRVRVIKKERREELRPVEDIPDDWRSQPIPTRWMVK